MKAKQKKSGIEIEGLSIEEMDFMARVATKIFDGWSVPDNISLRQLFIVGFLKGREYTLSELGCLSDNEVDSDEQAREFISKYFNG